MFYTGNWCLQVCASASFAKFARLPRRRFPWEAARYFKHALVHDHHNTTIVPGAHVNAQCAAHFTMLRCATAPASSGSDSELQASALWFKNAYIDAEMWRELSTM